MRFTRQAVARLQRQLGVVNRRQLLALGYGPKQIDAMLRAGHLEAAAHGVYRRTGSPGGRAQDAMIAVLRSRAPARACGLLLLALIGCEGYEVEDSDFTLLLPPGRRLVRAPFRWRTDHAPGLHGATVGGIPAVTPVRNLLELAVDLTDDDALLLAADRLRWRTRKGAADLTPVTARIPAHPGTARLRQLGLLDADRPESPGERGLERVLAPLPFPVEWQVWVAPDLRVDVLIRDACIVLEYDGTSHRGARDRVADAARDRRLEALGYLVVHLTAEDLRAPEALRRRIDRLRTVRLGVPSSA